MRRVPCSYKGCGDRRAHYESQEPRGKPAMIEVPDDHKGPSYCSFECAIYDGAWSAKSGVVNGGSIDKAIKAAEDAIHAD